MTADAKREFYDPRHADVPAHQAYGPKPPDGTTCCGCNGSLSVSCYYQFLPKFYEAHWFCGMTCLESQLDGPGSCFNRGKTKEIQPS